MAARVLAPPAPSSVKPEPTVVKCAAGDWSASLLPVLQACPTTPESADPSSDDDPANAGIRREPNLPDHEEVVPRRPVAREFEFAEDELDDDTMIKQRMVQQFGSIVRQASLVT